MNIVEQAANKPDPNKSYTLIYFNTNSLRGYNTHLPSYF